MVQEEFKVKGYEYEFRLAKMNAIEILAIQTQIKMDSIDTSKKFFDSVLERIEVRCDNEWLPVKTKNRNIYYPASLEDDIALAKGLIDYFVNVFLKAVFQKSNESKV